MAEPDGAQAGLGEPQRRGCRRRCSTARRTARARRARRAGARPRRACGSCRCRAGRGSARCRRCAARRRPPRAGARRARRRAASTSPARSGAAGAARAATSRSRARSLVASAAFARCDRRVAAIERDLGGLGIERVVAIELVDGAVEHQPQRSAPRGARARRGPRPARRDARPTAGSGRRARSAGCRGRSRRGPRRCTRTRSPGADLLVDDPQVRQRDPERDALGEHAARALERDLRARRESLGAPRGRQAHRASHARPPPRANVTAPACRRAVRSGRTGTSRCEGADPAGIVRAPCPSRSPPSA